MQAILGLMPVFEEKMDGEVAAKNNPEALEWHELLMIIFRTPNLYRFAQFVLFVVGKELGDVDLSAWGWVVLTFDLHCDDLAV